MARNTRCHSDGDTVIKKFVEDFDKAIASSPIVLSSDIQKHFGPKSGLYLRGHLTLIDSSTLEIAIFASESHHAVVIDKYRLHYMDQDRQMLFRYDNAPHHQEIDSFPHHKHVQNKIVRSNIPSLKNLLEEISSIIIGKTHQK